MRCLFSQNPIGSYHLWLIELVLSIWKALELLCEQLMLAVIFNWCSQISCADFVFRKGEAKNAPLMLYEIKHYEMESRPELENYYHVC
jgi:hypothetical protein